MNRLWTIGLGWGCVLAAGTLAVRPALESRGLWPETASHLWFSPAGAELPQRGPTRTGRPVHEKPSRDLRAIVHVGGRVRNSGQVPWQPGMTAWEAIGKAGGADEFGALNRVLITHRDQMRSYNLREEDQRQVVVVDRGDTIEIPERVIFGQ